MNASERELNRQILMMAMSSAAAQFKPQKDSFKSPEDYAAHMGEFVDACALELFTRFKVFEELGFPVDEDLYNELLEEGEERFGGNEEEEEEEEEEPDPDDERPARRGRRSAR